MNSKHQSYKPQEFRKSLATSTSIQGLTHECLKLARHNSFLEEKTSELEALKERTQYLQKSLKVAVGVAFGNPGMEKDAFQVLMTNLSKGAETGADEEIEVVVEDESTSVPETASPTSPASSSWCASRSRNQK